jgi:hypothetical protein
MYFVPSIYFRQSCPFRHKKKVSKRVRIATLCFHFLVCFPSETYIFEELFGLWELSRKDVKILIWIFSAVCVAQ